MKQTTSENVWPRIVSKQKTLQKHREAQFFLRRQPHHFENMKLVARRKNHFWVSLAILLLLNSFQKEVFWYLAPCRLDSSRRRITRSDVSVKSQ